MKKWLSFLNNVEDQGSDSGELQMQKVQKQWFNDCAVNLMLTEG